jgi:hypothetical protein
MHKSHMMNFMACVLIASCAAPTMTRESPILITGFNGVARIGPGTRAVIFHFDCSSISGPMITGVLAVQLMIPAYASLRPVFDFDLLK